MMAVVIPSRSPHRISPWLMGWLLMLLLVAAPFSTEAFTNPSISRRASTTISRPITQLHGVVQLLGRFRKKRQVPDMVETIAVGSPLPEGDVEQFVVTGDDDKSASIEGEPVSIHEVLGNGKSILLGMPGAFTPTCSQEHLPGYVKNSDKFAKLGYDKIVVVTTNDKFVNQEWMQSQGIDLSAANKNAAVSIVSDGDGDFVKSLGLAEDLGFGMGVRSQRFALVTDDDGRVSHLLTDEDAMNQCDATSASSLLKLLTPASEVEESDEVNPVVLGGIGAAVALVIAAQAMSVGGGGGAPTPAPVTPKPAVMQAAPAKSAPKSESSFSLLKDFM